MAEVKPKVKPDPVKAYRKRVAASGGKALLKKRGPDHFKKLAQKRWGKKK